MAITQSRQARLKPGPTFIAFALCLLPFALFARAPVETLLATDALPAHLVSQMREPAAYVALPGGDALVFDRGSHAVFRTNAARTTIKRVVDIGQQAGQILRPIEFAAGPEGMFAVADVPFDRERVQLFLDTGSLFGGFGLPARPGTALAVNGVSLSGIGGMQFVGPSLLVNVPESGALITEFDQQGRALRQIGVLRRTGEEANRALHLALNLGIPLADPAGGFYFVFRTGAPLIRKYDAAGTLIFERHVEGVELDSTIQDLPTVWPAELPRGSAPLVTATVRTAAIDPAGRLWISLAVPFTYVYDRAGDKIRTIQFRGASVLTPVSFFFASATRLLVAPGCYEFTVK